jgi:hypothetical protein
VVEKLANITKTEDGFVLLGDGMRMTKSDSVVVQLFSSKKDIVENYIPDKGKP